MLYCRRCACPLSGDFCPRCGTPRDDAASPYVLYDPLRDALLSPSGAPNQDTLDKPVISSALPSDYIPAPTLVHLENLPQERDPRSASTENTEPKAVPPRQKPDHDPILPSTFRPNDLPPCQPDPFSDALYISLTPPAPPVYNASEPDAPGLAYRFVLALFLLILGSLCGYLTFQYLFFPQFFSYLQNLL